MFTDIDIEYMRQAIDQAGKGIGRVNPNPLVGAVIVLDGKVIGRGYHMLYGREHAERNALADCSANPRGATMYVTLEPCCHTGKQPPCTEAIIEAGIARVVVGMTDPNPLVAGKGIQVLRDASIDVQCGLLEEEIRRQNRVFLKYITTRIPWVVMKGAVTLDGRIASHTGDSKWVSSEESRRKVHLLRHRYMAVLVGSGTVKADNPMLNCRIEGLKSPIRVVADSKASISMDSAIVCTASDYRTIIAHTAQAPASKLEALAAASVQTLECAEDSGKVDIPDLLRRLGEMGIDSVLVEGGAALNWSFIRSGAVDELYLFVAPKIIGGALSKGFVAGEGFALMSDAFPMDIDTVEYEGGDIMVHAFAK